jgi:hypothetical protein
MGARFRTDAALVEFGSGPAKTRIVLDAAPDLKPMLRRNQRRRPGRGRRRIDEAYPGLKVSAVGDFLHLGALPAGRGAGAAGRFFGFDDRQSGREAIAFPRRPRTFGPDALFILGMTW